MGEQRVSPFPHKTLSYNTLGKFYSPITLPVSNWYVGSNIAQAITDPFGGYYYPTMTSINAAVDFYYDHGLLINFYTHLPTNDGSIGQEYVTYSMSKPKLWSTNSVGVNDWWRLRSNVVVTPMVSAIGSSYIVTAAISGATDPETAVEVVLPPVYIGNVTVFLDGTQASSSDFQTTTNGVKVRVGSSVAKVRVQNVPNQPPLAANDLYSTKSNTALNQAAPGVLSNDTDFEGATLTAKLVSEPVHGTLTLNADGSFAYTPMTNYAGSDSFTYIANDGTVNSNLATVIVSVQSQPPVAINDAFSTNSNTALNQAAPGVLFNDADPQGWSLATQLLSYPAHGTLTLNANGSFVYTPTANYVGSDSFTYLANNGTSSSNTATVTISVMPTLISLTLNPATVTGMTAPQGLVTLNSAAPIGGVVVALSVNSPAASVPASATVPSGSSSATFTIPTTTVTNSTSAIISAYYAGVTQTATLTITPAVLFSDEFSRDPNTTTPLLPWVGNLGKWSITNGVLQGTSSPLTYATIYISTSPTWTDYTVESQVQFPAGGFGGGIGGRVNPANGARYGAWIYPEESLGGSKMLKLVKFSDWTTWNGSPMQQVSLTSVGTGWHALKMVFNGSRIQVFYDGTLMIDVIDNNFGSLPAYLSGGITGEMWTYTNSYAMGLDNMVVSTSGTITPPAATNDTYSTKSNATLNQTAPGVLSNDTDPQGATLTALRVSGPVHGTLTLNANGSFIYTPMENYVGSDSFTYMANDGTANSNVATVIVLVQSQPPVAVNDTYRTNSNTVLSQAAPGVQSNDADPQGLSLTTQLLSDPAHGTLILNANGSFVYTPTVNYVGSDSFTYLANNGTSSSNTATVTISVMPTLISLTLNPTTVTGTTASQGTVTLNIAAPNGGVVVALSDNSPAASVSASVTVPSGSSSATFTISTTTVASSTSAIISASYAGVTQTATLTITPAVLFSDDFIRDPNAITPLSPWVGNLGKWTITNDVLQGTSSPLTYATIYISTTPPWTDYTVESQVQFPAGGFGGGIGGRVDPANGARYGAWIYPEGSLGGSKMLKLVKFSDWTTWNGSPMQQVSLTSVGTGWHALKMVFNGNRIQVFYDGTLKIDVTDNNFGSLPPYLSGGITGDMWSYTNSYAMGLDNIVVSTSAAITPAAAVNDTYSTKSNAALNQTAPGVLSNDTDPQGATLTAKLVSGPVHGTLTLNANGSFVYTPIANYVGSDSFSYSASNGTNNSNVALVKIEVLPLLVSMDVSPASVAGGTTSQCTVTLSGPAPSGGLVLSLSSDSPKATVPAIVTVASGSSSITLAVTTTAVASSTPATITAIYGAVTKTTTLTIIPETVGMSAPSQSHASVTNVTSFYGTLRSPCTEVITL